MYLAQAMTEEDLENTEMQRASWWQCILSVIWCAVDAIKGSDDDGKKKAQIAAQKEAAAKELQNYLGGCECEQELIEYDLFEFIHS